MQVRIVRLQPFERSFRSPILTNTLGNPKTAHARRLWKAFCAVNRAASFVKSRKYSMLDNETFVSTGVLFKPVKVGNWELSNRIAMAPMSRFRASATEWIPARYSADYYGQRNDCGLIITEATQVSPDAVGYPRSPGIYSDEQTEIWKDIVAAIHQGSAKAVVQLWHTGRISHPHNRPLGDLPMAPSAVAPGMQIITDEHGMVDIPTPREMTKADIKHVVEAYANAARNAKIAGFDGIEIHAANGYLIEQFSASNTNLRSDDYGGSVENRLKFLAEIIEAVATVLDRGQIGVRFSPYSTLHAIRDADPKGLFEAQLRLAQAAGVGYVHVVRPDVAGNEDVVGYVQTVDVLAMARRLYTGPLIAAGLYSHETAEKDIVEGRVDIVAFGRPYVSNPDLVERMKAGKPLTELNRANLYLPGPVGYTDYPFA
jgi:N-ethylmaleimide reductase